MMKKLSQVNVVLLAIILAVAVFYAGFECVTYLFAHIQEVNKDTTGLARVNLTYLITTFQYSIVFTVLLIAGIMIAKEQRYPSTYFTAVKFMFIYPAAVFIFCALSYDPEFVDHHTDKIDCFVVPGIILFFSTIIAINYLICYFKAKDVYEDF